MNRIANAKRSVGFLLILTLVFTTASSASGSQEQQVPLPPELVAGGKIFLKNDLQAWSDAMLVFRGFRREFGRIERFEEVDSEEEADLIGILSADPGVVETNRIINQGVPYPSGFASSKIMLLVIFEAESMNLLWFDAVDWDTTGNVTRVDSHEQLARRLRAALDGSG
jgi:hypothetical protein